MAEGDTFPKDPPWSSKILCRYYLHGACKNRTDCPYSHDKGDKPDSVCRFYLKGSCTYGDNCRYDHVKPKKDARPSQLDAKRVLKPLGKLVIPHNDGSSMVNLSKSKTQNSSDLSLPLMSPKPEDWVKATEFVPGQPYICSTIPSSYSGAVGKSTDASLSFETANNPIAKGEDISQLLCPYLMHGACPYEDECEYLHGDYCDLCGVHALVPGDKMQQEKHTAECVLQHEKDMELSFAVASSKNKSCGICMDTIMEKMPPSEQRFGIMSNCNHCFCLSCIRKWRGAKQFENEIVRACPECRMKSDFVTPSKYWVDTKEEKEKLIRGYKKALGDKSCKYFNQGNGECPFNEKCFYRHALPDGTLVESQPRTRRKRHNADGDLDLMQRINLWDFLEERENRPILLDLEADLDNLLLHLILNNNNDSDSDSDYDGFW